MVHVSIRNTAFLEEAWSNRSPADMHVCPVDCNVHYECMKAACRDDQMMGADLSLVTVGRSFTVANGFPPLKTQNTQLF